MKEALTEEDPEGPSTSAPQIRQPVSDRFGARGRSQKKTKTKKRRGIAESENTHLRVEAAHRPRPGHQAQAREVEPARVCFFAAAAVGEPAETRLGHHERALRRGTFSFFFGNLHGTHTFRLFGVVGGAKNFVSSFPERIHAHNWLHAAHGVVPESEVARGVMLVGVPLRVVRVFCFVAGEPQKVGAPPEEPAARVVGVALALEDREHLHGRGRRRSRILFLFE